MHPRTILLAAAVTLVASGCTHAMDISNIPGTPPVGAVRTQPVVVGIANNSPTLDGEPYVREIANALQRSGNVSRVVYPFVGGHEADVVLHVGVRPQYRGAGTNFFVNFPGFLIFTPAWHGYSYHADIATTVEVVAKDTGEPVESFEWQHDYQFKQADKGRTWIEISLFEVGSIALISGFFATQYDTDQTPEFMRQVSPSYTGQIVSRINDQLAALPAREPESPSVEEVPETEALDK